jgi:hypothetical protein
MAPIAKGDLDQITAAIATAMQSGFAQISQALAQQQPKAAMPAQAKTAAYKYGSFIPKGEKADAASLVQRDQNILNGFHRKGFKDVVLKDRNDPSKPFNVKPFKLWLEDGRVVRKGQKGVKGLFHITQTDALPTAKPGKAKAKKA